MVETESGKRGSRSDFSFHDVDWDVDTDGPFLGICDAAIDRNEDHFIFPSLAILIMTGTGL